MYPFKLPMKMVESDHSETEEENMIKLELELDSDTDATTSRKRSRMEDSEDEEQGLPIKKHRNSISKQSEILNENNAEANKNNADEYNGKEERHRTCLESKENADKKLPSELDMDRENVKKQEDKSIKQTDESESHLDKNISSNEACVKIKVEKEDTESEDNSTREPVANTNAMFLSNDGEIKKELIKENEVNEEESVKEVETKQNCTNNRSVDTEVVDGLELSVECASDKELSSESEDETNVKPRQKTIIVKVKPEESEVECSSTEEEKPNVQEILNIKVEVQKKNVKRKDARVNSSKVKTSGSEDSHNNDSDEDYSPRIKKKIKRSTMKRQKRSESTKKNSPEKNAECASDDEADADITVAQEAIKMKNDTDTEEDLSEKESSTTTSKSESKTSEDEKKSRKNMREKRSNDRWNKHIQTLKKYLSAAGIKIRSYNDIWADCKTNTAKIKRLKELLEKNGVSGRPTLEKCKRVKEKNEEMREISELDVSNIISEGRVTRARRNIDNGKKAISPSTPPGHREAFNTFKRIKTVVDSDSE
ncbi:HIRA-interacting protein 3 isoform X2 [Ooceraea biroi]|uniref:HIRA-interacting protein 3 isoform X2 n=1 Tax=Ooceraea biroi TaxID=2015173 RepID=UPI0005B9A5E9|nr:HIRA-interacting protein 3 isoform X2 [Ooceraea biroi]XP_011349608.1 HIRA-interacting protein 3 isoform X2 [Ooceraea biroi]